MIEINFFFKLALGFWLFGALLYAVIRRLSPHEKFEAHEQQEIGAVGFLICAAIGIVCAILGVDLHPEEEDFDAQRIADGLCIAGETELYQDPKKYKKNDGTEAFYYAPYHRTKYTCRATEFWRESK